MARTKSMSIEFDLDALTLRHLTIAELPDYISDQSKLFWVHVNLENEEDLQKAAAVIQLPDLVKQLCQQKTGLPKLIDHDDEIVLKIQLPSMQPNKSKIFFSNLIIYLNKHFCFTAIEGEHEVITDFVEAANHAVRHAKTTCFILFLILDNLVNQYSQILFRYELIAEKLDYKIIHRTKQNIYDKVNMIKEQIIKIKRGIIGLREIVIRLSGRKISVISNECRSSLLNLSGHSHMVVHECDSIREILNGLLGQIENALIQKMNKTMKILTSFAAIFLPLTLIAGIYGMNFRFMPELEWQYGYFLVLGSMVFCAGLLLYIFKKNDWF